MVGMAQPRPQKWNSVHRAWMWAGALSLIATPAMTQEAAAPAAGGPHLYSTKAPFGAGSETHAPAANPAAAGAPSPFGRGTASEEKPVMTGPRGVAAVPVENVDTIETGEPLPAEPDEAGANPVAEDPAQPTQLTAPMFSAKSNAAQLIAVVRVLNKVTAHGQNLELKDGQSAVSGKLHVTASRCQHSDPTSLPDDAALITLSEITAAEQPERALFSGWMYASSPSVNALEHPIYDVTLVSCKETAPPPLPEKKPAATKPKKK